MVLFYISNNLFSNKNLDKKDITTIFNWCKLGFMIFNLLFNLKIFVQYI